jgi:CubicO group peptidase (beta-lactamase class C family)
MQINTHSILPEITSSICVKKWHSFFTIVPLLLVFTFLTADPAKGNGMIQPISNIDLADYLFTQENDTARVIDTAYLADFIDGIIDANRRHHRPSAVTVSVVKNDSLLFSRGYGLANIEEERAAAPGETLFRIGSVSKTYTWTAIMMLAEEGLLDLDTDINQYLNEVEIKEAFGEPVTLRQLMSHRAGFEDTFRLFAVADDDPRTLSQLLQEHQPKRVYPPGKRTSYSNWGSALASQIVEDVSGISYKTFLQERILDPLGLNNTIIDHIGEMSPEVRENLATGYKTEKGAMTLQGYMQIGPYWPAGGMAATAHDMARWMRFHLNGGELDGVRLMSADTHQQMWTRAFNDRPHAADVAHGFQDASHRGMRLFGHSGGTAAFLTNMIMVPELNLGIFISQNSTESFMPVMQFPWIVIDHLLGKPFQMFLLEESDSDNLSEFAGTYLNNRRVFSTFIAALGLTSTATVTPVSGEALTVNLFGEEIYFVQVPGQADLFEDAVGQRLAFIRNDRGKVQALADGTGVHTYERVGFFKNPNTFLGAFGFVLLLSLTTLLGAWRRFGRGDNPGFSSRAAGFISILTSLAVFIFTAAVAALISSVAGFDISEMTNNYPFTSMYLTHYTGWLAAIMSLLMLAGLWSAWTDSGWPIIRRLHYTIFALVLFFFVTQLWTWRIIGAAVF